MVEIKSLLGNVLREVDADNLSNASLSSADLRNANLRYANLSSADLRSTNLFYANLSYADLRYADLFYANLGYANLRYADLRGADLSYADLINADLRSTKINWNSHSLIAEILRQKAENDYKRRMIAGLILVSTDWCWKDFLALPISKKDKAWVFSVLKEYVTNDNPAPIKLEV